jgi:hypothetical protein
MPARKSDPGPGPEGRTEADGGEEEVHPPHVIRVEGGGGGPPTPCGTRASAPLVRCGRLTLTLTPLSGVGAGVGSGTSAPASRRGEGPAAERARGSLVSGRRPPAGGPRGHPQRGRGLALSLPLPAGRLERGLLLGAEQPGGRHPAAVGALCRHGHGELRGRRGPEETPSPARGRAQARNGGRCDLGARPNAARRCGAPHIPHGVRPTPVIDASGGPCSVGRHLPGLMPCLRQVVSEHEQGLREQAHTEAAHTRLT